MKSFPQVYRRLVEQYVGPLTEEDGCSEREIEAAEARCGIALPGVLKDFYRLAGCLDEVNTAHHQLLPIRGLKSIGRILPFYEEAEAVLCWCLNGAKPVANDPPVYQFVRETRGLLEDGGNLSDFLINMFFVQCLNGALKYGAIATLDTDQASQVSHMLQPTELVVAPYSEDHTVFALEDGIASLAPLAGRNGFMFTISTQVDSSFNAMRQQFPVRWLLETKGRTQ